MCSCPTGELHSWAPPDCAASDALSDWFTCYRWYKCWVGPVMTCTGCINILARQSCPPACVPIRQTKPRSLCLPVCALCRTFKLVPVPLPCDLPCCRLTNTVMLLHMLQKHTKLASGLHNPYPDPPRSAATAARSIMGALLGRPPHPTLHPRRPPTTSVAWVGTQYSCYSDA